MRQTGIEAKGGGQGLKAHQAAASARFGVTEPLIQYLPSRTLQLAWQRQSNHLRASIMALLFLVSGVLCLLAARWGMATDHRLLIGGIGAFGIAAAGGMYLWRNAIPGWVLDAAGATVALAVGILAAVAITPTGVLGLSPALFAVCILNGYFATSKALGWQLAWASASFLTGVLLAQKPATLIPAVNAIVVAVVSSVILNRLAERMRQQSSFDALTGAYNRTAWWQIAEHTLQDPDQTSVSVAILDLDNFKKVNDSQGHLAGDSLLQSAAQKWLHDLNPPSVLGRFGGDEFVILFPGLTAAEAEQELMRLGPIPHHTWSFGIAGAQPKDTVPMLLHRADTALLEAKKLRRQQEKPGNGADRSTSGVIGTNTR